jgi:DNA invertase Pin-like site-specific DNA recombinase
LIAWRAARGTLRNIIGQLQELDCGFVSLGESWCDTQSDVGRLMLTIMVGISEFERSLIRKRCDEGIKRARWMLFGRAPKLDAGQRRIIAERYAAGETMAELARDYDVSEPTMWRALQ